jgi:predicted amidohydrolase YtcJ
MKDIYYNAVIHAKKGMDVDTMGVENGRVAFIGTFLEAKQWEGDEEIVWHDMSGAFIVPGFIDSHLHLLQYGNGLSSPNLTENTSSIKAVVDELSAYKGNNDMKSEAWIVGSGWNQECFEEDKRFPTRYDLDQVSNEQPVMAYRSCRHIACVNTAALQAAGITRETMNPEGGSIDFDENGEPTGILRENAINLVSRLIPSPEVGEIKYYMIQAMKKLNSYGITSVQSDDFGAFSGVPYETVIRAYQELEAEGLLTVKVYEQCLFEEMSDLKGFIEKGYRTGEGSPFFAIGPLKIISDGSLGARTALLSEPYADDTEHPDNCGIAIYSQSELYEKVIYASRNGMQVAIHAIGDQAMKMAAQSIEKALCGDK